MSLSLFTSIQALASWHGLGRLPLLTAVLALAGTLGQAPADKTGDFNRLTPEQLKAGIENQHPAAYYVLAGKLLRAGDKDEAVFWFYAGQLRYRFHLLVNPKLDPSGDPALFTSLSDVMGTPINEYAFGDITQLVATIDKVLAWDERTDNGFTSKTTNAAAWKDIRDGLGKMRAYVLQNREQIQAKRKQNGLDNRKP
jgi:hypothetical protein